MKEKFYTRLAMVFAAFLLFSYTATAQTTITVTIANEADDAEEGENGLMANESSDLELGRYDDWTQNDTAQGVQIIGIKFDTIPITKGSTISAASIQFTADKGGVEAAQVTIYGEMVGNPKAYTDKDVPLPDSSVNIRYDISSRPKTTASAVWDIPEWVTGDAGDAQKTVDLSGIIQEIIDGPDWVAGNSIAFILEHTGPSATIDPAVDGREAEAGPGDDAAKLTVTFNWAAGINPGSAEFSSTIYPNPARGLLYIDNPSTDNFGYKIYTINGQMVTSRRDIAGSTIEVDVSEFAKGLYLVDVITAERTQTQKLILQ